METIEKPWGWYAVLDDYKIPAANEQVKIKLLCINPDQSISLQRHQKRNELWQVLAGQLKLTQGLDPNELTEVDMFVGNEVMIGGGYWHKAVNTGEKPVFIYETQTGSECVEEDIERLEDQYGRA